MPTISNSNAATKKELTTVVGNGFNVKNYGAIGNGVASDNAAIQVAIDAAETSSGTVVVPEGTYNIDADIVINSDNVTLILQVGAILKATSALTKGVIHVDADASNISIIGQGKIDANTQVNATGIFADGIGDNLYIDGIELVNSPPTQQSIRIIGTSQAAPYTNVKILNVYIHDTGEGIVLEKVKYSTVADSRIVDMTDQDCLEFSACEFGLVTNCYLVNPFDGNSCIDVFSNVTATKDITVTNCYCIQDAARTAGNGSIGFSVGGSPDPERITFNATHVKGVVPGTQTTSTSSFSVGGRVTAGIDIIFSNCMIDGVCHEDTGYALSLKGACTVFNTRISHCAEIAIFIQNAAGKAIVLNSVYIRNSHYDASAAVAGVIDVQGTAPDSLKIVNCHFVNDLVTLVAQVLIQLSYTGTIDNGLYIGGCSSDGNTASGGAFKPVIATEAELVMGDNFFLGVGGSSTQKFYGPRTFTITYSGTSAAKNHGCGYTPGASQISATLIDPGSGTAPGDFYVDTITTGAFTINSAGSVTNAVFAIHISGKGSDHT